MLSATDKLPERGTTRRHPERCGVLGSVTLLVIGFGTCVGCGRQANAPSAIGSAHADSKAHTAASDPSGNCAIHLTVSGWRTEHTPSGLGTLAAVYPEGTLVLPENREGKAPKLSSVAISAESLDKLVCQCAQLLTVDDAILRATANESLVFLKVSSQIALQCKISEQNFATRFDTYCAINPEFVPQLLEYFNSAVPSVQGDVRISIDTFMPTTE